MALPSRWLQAQIHTLFSRPPWWPRQCRQHTLEHNSLPRTLLKAYADPRSRLHVQRSERLIRGTRTLPNVRPALRREGELVIISISRVQGDTGLAGEATTRPVGKPECQGAKVDGETKRINKNRGYAENDFDSDGRRGRENSSRNREEGRKQGMKRRY